MSGHSKWANIRVRKSAQDARRGKIFTRHARLIEIAARAGGGDPGTNSALRTAIENAKADSVPNANIERAIKKGTGELKGEAMAEVLYAAMGPGGVALLIECLTENRNRTLNNVRSKIEKHGGRWTDLGSVQWMFSRKGVVIAEKTVWSEPLELQLIEAGAEDIDASGNTIIVTTDAAHWTAARDVLKQAGCPIMEAGLTYIPSQRTLVTDPTVAKQLHALMTLVEEDDDVADVHTNADMPEDIAAQCV